MSVLEVPMPPTTEKQAEAWVEWAEAEIGVGWHPDTDGEDYISFDPPRDAMMTAQCACGETFIPDGADDLIHVENEKGDECGLPGLIVSLHSGDADPLFEGERLDRYNEGLEAAHRLLPDIYLTSMTIFQRLHPELLRHTQEGQDA